ncbi:hypothetical protein P7C73_g4682, partial [Tremellales sp. Uapishka_1]
MVYTIVVHLRAKTDQVEKLKAKLIEAASVYRKDKETLDWLVMQDPKDETKFCIVERYEKESSQQYHLGNPVSRDYGSEREKEWGLMVGRHSSRSPQYWKTFDPYVIPLLDGDMDLTRWEEM